jgi:DNA mismatch repair protein MutL
MKNESSARRIKVLRESEARKIAAGEVIDRPLSLVRELLDNAIDAGASSIELHLEAGGTEAVRLVDDGCGMGREDLALCCIPHATSKIESIEDLSVITSLGFRGEALASIASCTRLSITSSNGTDGGKLVIHGGELVVREDAPLKRGTIVEARDLFFNMPARKKFLKSTASEGTGCKTTFIEKALPFPGITFRYFSDGELRLFLPASDLMERVCAAYSGQVERNFIHEVQEDFGSFSLHAVVGGPSLFKKDRKFIQIFVNGRRIQEFSLVQAVEYGFTGFLPGGHYPVSFVFISVDPSLIDFNIHPAKREVRFKNLPEIHHGIVTALKNFLAKQRPLSQAPLPLRTRGFDGLFARAGEPRGRQVSFEGASKMEPISVVREELREYRIEERNEEFRYIGQAMGLFLIAEKGERLLIIDQHAAHERILFDELSSAEHEAQPLLIPLSFDVEENQTEAVIGRAGALKRAGVGIERRGDTSFELTTLPSGLNLRGEDIIQLLSDQGGTEDEVLKTLYADVACKKAIKDGETLDRRTGEDLVRRTLALPFPRCPHGRPLWYEVSREDLFKVLGRII